MKNTKVRKMVLTAIFTAIAVVGSTFSFPIMGSKCAPVQHFINVLSAVFLGPSYAVMQAYMASLIRNLLGLGTLLAFPGSICGAVLSAVLYKKIKKLPAAYFGEIFGTGIIGGLTSYPVAAFIMGNKAAALTTFVVPFLISTIGGTVIAMVVVTSMSKSELLSKLQKNVE